MTSAWQVTLDLIRKVPDFFLFAVERGISDINTKITDSLITYETSKVDAQNDDSAFALLLATLINFQVYVIVSYNKLYDEDVLHTNINQIKENLIGKVFTRLRGLLQCRSIAYCRVLSAGVLDSSYVTEGCSRDTEREEPCSTDCTESGYEADESR